MTLDIMQGNPEDAAVIACLLKAQLVEHHLRADDAGIARGIALAFAPGSPARILLAKRGDDSVGIALTNRHVSVEHGGEILWLEELYVVPEARRSGVASALLRFLEACARESGQRAIELEVVPTQTAALMLYDRHGYERLNRLRVSRVLPPSG